MNFRHLLGCDTIVNVNFKGQMLLVEDSVLKVRKQLNIHLVGGDFL